MTAQHADSFSRGDLPEAERTVEARRGQETAIARDAQITDGCFVTVQHSCLALRGDVPEADDPIPLRRHERASIGRDGQRPRAVFGTPYDVRDSGLEIPERHLAGHAHRRDRTSVGRVDQLADSSLSPAQSSSATSLRVEDTDRARGAVHRHEAPVGGGGNGEDVGPQVPLPAQGFAGQSPPERSRQRRVDRLERLPQLRPRLEKLTAQEGGLGSIPQRLRVPQLGPPSLLFGSRALNSRLAHHGGKHESHQDEDADHRARDDSPPPSRPSGPRLPRFEEALHPHGQRHAPTSAQERFLKRDASPNLFVPLSSLFPEIRRLTRFGEERDLVAALLQPPGQWFPRADQRLVDDLQLGVLPLSAFANEYRPRVGQTFEDLRGALRQPFEQLSPRHHLSRSRRRYQTNEDLARERHLFGRHPFEHVVREVGQRPLDTTHGLVRRRGEQPTLAIPALPKAAAGKLQDRQAGRFAMDGSHHLLRKSGILVFVADDLQGLDQRLLE